MAKKRAFVRYTKSGDIVPGSLVVTTNGGYPDKSSLWEEVTVSKCCPDVCGCEKETITLPFLITPEIGFPYYSIQVMISCKTPALEERYIAGYNPGFTTLEDLFSYFNQTTENIQISLASLTEISVTFCKRKIECLHEDAPCFGYVLGVYINGDSFASVCNINN